jgi:arylsulfatase A-like enzyme
VRGDAIQEFDWCVGGLVAALDRLGLAQDTLILVTSDNGGVMDDGYADGAVQDANGHACNGPLRGFKGGLFEGGHRVPLVARWPGRIKPGLTSDALVCHVDMLATFAAIAGRDLPADAGPDSLNVLPALLGEKQEKPSREHLVMHAGSGALAIRKGPWKLIPGNRGGGQLYNLADDLSEKNDVAAQHPEIVKELSDLLTQVRERGRSRP